MMDRPAQPAPAPFAKIRSPCRGVCRLSGPPDSALCVGCRRTTEEIGNWLSYTAEERVAVLGKLAERKLKA